MRQSEGRVKERKRNETEEKRKPELEEVGRFGGAEKRSSGGGGGA